MESVITISLGGYVFQIEQTAYQRLRGYLDSLIEKCKTTAEGRDIIASIEERIAELLSYQGLESQTVRLEDVERIIKQIGDIESAEPNTYTPPPHDPITPKNSFRLYRDTQNRIIGGVCAGIAARTGIPVWAIRLLLILATLYYGFSILLYCILWFAIPQAISAKERAEMRGEPITFDRIQDEVRKHYNAVRHEMKSNPGNAIRRNQWPFIERIGYALGAIVLGLLKVVFIIAGIALLIGSVIGAAICCIAGFALLFNKHLFDWVHSTLFLPYDILCAQSPLMVMLVLLAILIPFGFLFMLGLHLTIRIRLNLLTTVILFSIWLATLGAISVWGAFEVFTYPDEISVDQPKQPLNIGAGDTLRITSDLNTFAMINASVAGCTPTALRMKAPSRRKVQAYLRSTTREQAYVIVSKHTHAQDDQEGRIRLNSIQYEVRDTGNSLFIPAQFSLDGYSHTTASHEWVKVEVFLPEGSHIKVENEATELFPKRFRRKYLEKICTISNGKIWSADGHSRTLPSD